MPERFDITLGGQGYMVAPNTYRRGLDHPGTDGRPAARVVQREWRGGAGRAIADERDTFWSSFGLLPHRAGSGVGPGPREVQTTVTGIDTTATRHGVIATGRPYFAAGGQLWRPARAGVGLEPANLAGATALGAPWAAPIVGLATDGISSLYVQRQSAPYVRWDIASATYDTSPALGFGLIAFYQGALWGTGADPIGLYRATSTTAAVREAQLDSPPVKIVPGKQGLYVGTQGALFQLDGTVDAASNTFKGERRQLAFANGAGFGADFAHLAEYQGHMYTWYGGEVHRVHLSSGGPSLVPTGLRGTSCRGLTAAGGYLIACVTDTPQGRGAQLWAWDGFGWWGIARSTDAARDWFGVMPSAGFFSNADLLTWGFGSDKLYGFQLSPRATQPGLAPAGDLVTALWDGRQPDENKSWLRVGAELGRHEGAAAVPAYSVALDWSTDGATWTEAGAVALTDTRLRRVAFALPAGTAGRLIRLRYRLAGVVDDGPTLVALWAEYRTVEAPVRKRHWEFGLALDDDLVDRRGGRATSPAAQQIADLWAAYDAGGNLTFRDVDYDLAPVERTVRIVRLDEGVPEPADRWRWGNSRMRVSLVEV